MKFIGSSLASFPSYFLSGHSFFETCLSDSPKKGHQIWLSNKVMLLHILQPSLLKSDLEMKFFEYFGWRFITDITWVTHPLPRRLPEALSYRQHSWLPFHCYPDHRPQPLWSAVSLRRRLSCSHPSCLPLTYSQYQHSRPSTQKPWSQWRERTNLHHANKEKMNLAVLPLQ